MAKNSDARAASAVIAAFSVVGLVVCFVASGQRGADVPLVLYAIFGGGILGTDNLLKVLKSVFRLK